jgi:hypothetical protein
MESSISPCEKKLAQILSASLGFGLNIVGLDRPGGRFDPTRFNRSRVG